MHRSKRVALAVVALVVVGAVVAGAIYLHRYRQYQAREEAGRAAKQVILLTLQYREESAEIMDAMFQQREIDQAAYLGIATQDPEARFEWMEAQNSLDRWYMENLSQIDTSDCPRDFREAFEGYVQAVRVLETDLGTTNEDVDRALAERKQAGNRLARVADSYKVLIILPLGHRSFDDDSSR